MTNPDNAKLPPHSLEAERGLLACCIMGQSDVVPAIAERIRDLEVWYDIRHVPIWRSIVAMHAEGRAPLDVMSVVQRLKDNGRLDQAGGMPYIAELPDASPSSSNWSYYVEIVMQKHLARQAIAHAARSIETIRSTEGAIDTVIQQMIVNFTQLDELQQSASDTPARIKKPGEFQQGIWDLWFGDHAGEPGIELPFGFPWKIRKGELTLVLGEKGKGKSTFLSYLMLHAMRRGMKALVASMETRPEVTLKIMLAQLVGQSKMINNEANQAMLVKGISWLQQRCALYDFLGAVDYRVLLQAMGHAHTKLGCDFFLIDSLMRLGIADDDYAGQGRCALQLANFAAEHNSHVVLINHLNKSDGHNRARSRGSQQVVDNSHNVLCVERNEDKWAKIDDLRDEKERGVLDASTLAKKIEEMKTQWDAKILLYNQRWPGSRQNGSKQLWFLPDALQYAEVPNAGAINYIERWERYRTKEEIQDE